MGDFLCVSLSASQMKYLFKTNKTLKKEWRKRGGIGTLRLEKQVKRCTPFNVFCDDMQNLTFFSLIFFAAETKDLSQGNKTISS